MYENNTTDIRLEEKITFRTEGLEMVGGDQEALDILLEPGENQFIEFRNVLPKWSMQTSVSYSISLNN